MNQTTAKVIKIVIWKDLSDDKYKCEVVHDDGVIDDKGGWDKLEKAESWARQEHPGIEIEINESAQPDQGEGRDAPD